MTTKEQERKEIIELYKFESMNVEDYINFCQTTCKEKGKPLNTIWQYMMMLLQLEDKGLITKETQERLFDQLSDMLFKKNK